MNNKITVFKRIIYFIISLIIAIFIFSLITKPDNREDIVENTQFYKEENFTEFSKYEKKLDLEKDIEFNPSIKEEKLQLKCNKIIYMEETIFNEYEEEIKEPIIIEELNEDIELLQEPTEFRSLHSYGNFTEEEIILITNVVMHEVGGIYGSNSYVTITYANGYSETYYNTCLLHKIHAQVLVNQFYSSIFPSSLSKCISWYWDPGLTNVNYYSRNNSTWQHCKEDVLDIILNGGNLPSNVFAATCDPYFATYYPQYSLYAIISWNTGWYSGTFYYYQYNG